MVKNVAQIQGNVYDYLEVVKMHIFIKNLPIAITTFEPV